MAISPKPKSRAFGPAMGARRADYRANYDDGFLMRSFLKAIATALLSASAALTTTSAAAQPSECADPQQACGAVIQQECLARVGAGAIAAGDADDCEGQLDAYRQCLARLVEACPTARQTTIPEGETSIEALAGELGRLGGLIEAPETAVEFYNNALVYSRRGDLLSARRMYERAIVGGVDAVDVHQRYSQLLKAQEGLLGAREVYADLARRLPDNMGAQLANALLQPPSAREDALNALVEQEPPFAPAYYEIAGLYSQERLGDQSIEDKRSEKAALDAFVAADEAGRVYRWFLQKEMVEIWRESVRRRLAAYGRQALDLEPVRFAATPSNDSWTVTLLIAEAARAIRYRVDGGEIKPTGFLDLVDQRTGAPTPRPFIALPLSTRSAQIDVWYVDIGDVERGPFPLVFDAMEGFTSMAKNVFDNLTLQWVDGRAMDEDRFLVYFTHLLGHRCGLREIAFGVNTDEPNETLPLHDCAPERFAVVTDAPQLYLEFDGKIDRISVRLTYADGSESETRVFSF